MMIRGRFPRRPGSNRMTGASRRSRRSLSPGLEAMEDRVVLSTVTVISAADSGNGTLRAAIAAAQAGDTISSPPASSARRST